MAELKRWSVSAMWHALKKTDLISDGDPFPSLRASASDPWHWLASAVHPMPRLKQGAFGE
jgi:hypothetical protein